jgi:endonuclease/exonuclease/phosphatase (EEP) superfamily protein YafD
MLVHGWILAPSLDRASSPHPLEKSTALIRVLALNMHGDERTLEPTVKIIEGEKPTLILLAELPKDYQNLLSSLKEFYPYVIYQDPVHDSDVLLLSRWPIKKWEMERNPSSLPLLTAEICTPDHGTRCFTLAGLHAPVPFWSRGSAMQKHMFTRLVHVSKDQKNVPFIVLGDLNSTPWSPVFRSLLAQSELRSSAVGFGWQTTWFSRNPLLGLHIDHILINKQVGARNWWVGHHVGSDHYPVFADLELNWQ